MVLALPTEVGGQRGELGGAARLGPVAVLPGKAMWQQVLVVHVEGGGALDGPHEICKRDGRCLSNDEVDMVGGEACMSTPA